MRSSHSARRLLTGGRVVAVLILAVAFLPLAASAAPTPIEGRAASGEAFWSGTMTYRLNAHYFDDQGRAIFEVNLSENVVLSAPPDGQAPADGLYSATGSGSGASILHDYGCEDGYQVTRNWAGDVRNAENTRFYFAPSTTPGFAVMNETWGGWMDGTYTESGCGAEATSGVENHNVDFCLQPDQAGPAPTNEAGCDNMAFATPIGQSLSRFLCKRVCMGG